MRATDAEPSSGTAFAASPAPQAACLQRRCRMSAVPAVSLVIGTARAVAEPALPAWRGRTIEGYAFYRKHTVALLHRYLRISMELGRTPSLLSNVVFRGRVSSYQMKTFEDLMIFVIDIEKCLKQLDKSSQTVMTHMVLEDYTALETAAIMKESFRSVMRIYGEALDRLTREFLDRGLLDLTQNQRGHHAKPQSGTRLSIATGVPGTPDAGVAGWKDGCTE
jgi:hypothetical protein